MAHAATQAAPISGNTKTASNGKTNGNTTQPAAPAPLEPNRERAVQILSKSIYRELRENGYQPKQIVALATEIISLVTTEIGDQAAT